MDSTSSLDTRMAKALCHPVRVKSLKILNERVASPSEIAREIELPVANVSYHVNTLLRLGCIEEVEIRHVRGSIEHFYRATRRPTVLLDECEFLPASARSSLSAEIAAAAFRDLQRAFQDESFGERSDQHLTFTPLVLDEQGWKNVYAVLLETLDRVMEEQAASASRMIDGHSGGHEVRSVLSMFHYESLPHLG